MAAAAVMEALAAAAVAAVAVMKVLAASAMEGVIDNNQPKATVEEMAAETATATVTMTTTARAK